MNLHSCPRPSVCPSFISQSEPLTIKVSNRVCNVPQRECLGISWTLISYPLSNVPIHLFLRACGKQQCSTDSQRRRCGRNAAPRPLESSSSGWTTQNLRRHLPHRLLCDGESACPSARIKYLGWSLQLGEGTGKWGMLSTGMCMTRSLIGNGHAYLMFCTTYGNTHLTLIA